jgi:hypothetical protein
MMRCVACAIGFGSTLLAAGAGAETKTLAHAGIWEAFGGTTSSGSGFCGVSSGTARGQRFTVQVLAGSQTFTIQMETEFWKLDKGASIPVSLRFDDNPWHGGSTVVRFDDGELGLIFESYRANLSALMHQFSSSSTLVVQFGSGHLPQWRMSLEGGSVANTAFQDCMKTLK